MLLTARDIMTRSVVHAKPSDTVMTAARLLSEHNVSAAPVCDASGTVVGMVSEGDLIASLSESNVAKRTRWLDLLAEGTDLPALFLEAIKVGNRPISDLMGSPVVTASAGDTVPQLADLLVRHHIKRLPIVENGKLVGIVSRADLVRGRARTPAARVEGGVAPPETAPPTVEPS
jgi:CBS domain-containing protein